MDTGISDDPLLARLRAADPAALLSDPAIPAREQVAAARRRRGARRARRLSGAGALATCAAVLGLALAPGGGPGGSDRGVLLRAAEATLPAKSILRIETVTRYAGRGATATQRRIAWVLAGAGGRPLRVRTLYLGGSGPGVPAAGSELVSPGSADGAFRVESYDPATDTARVDVVPARGPLELGVLQVASLLRVAAHARGGQGTVRRTQGAVVYAAEQVDRPRGAKYANSARLQVWLDPKTSTWTRLRQEHRVLAPGETSRFYDERVISRRTLPDTPANRRFLRLRGPTR